MTYMLFDVETIVDEKRVLRTERPVRGTVPLPAPRPETDEEMAARVLKSICDIDPSVKSGDKSCFPPVRYHAPVTICMLLVDDKMNYLQHATVSETTVDPLLPRAPTPNFKANAQTFWNSYAYARATYPDVKLVSFGGIAFDLPCLEITALECGHRIPDWYYVDIPSYQDPRSLFCQKFHLDLYQYLSKGKGGSLSFYSRLIGLPGKMESTGAMVAQMLKEAEGQARVNAYCLTDVLNTYGVLFELMYAAGDLPKGYRNNPIFEATMNKCLVGAGAEAQAFKAHYTQTSLQATGVPF